MIHPVTPGSASRGRDPAWLTRYMRPAVSSPRAARFVRWVLPSALVLAIGVGYVAIDLWVQDIPEIVPGAASPVLYAGLVTLQAGALLLRHRAPLLAFAAVVALDAIILLTTAGELGIGSLAVVFATYTLARRSSRHVTAAAAITGALASTVAGAGAMLVASREPALVIGATALARVVLLYAIPIAVAEIARGRERLALALEDRNRMLERERLERAERARHAERMALARELHDIAGHHLSGIIVSAQAASALALSDPQRAREMMQVVQHDARMTLADLRQTVGLLRSDREGLPDAPAPSPSIKGIPALVDAARGRGQQVTMTSSGSPLSLGPIAEVTAYRMVQESLANAARHAPQAECTVDIDFASDAVVLTVSNTPPLDPEPDVFVDPTRSAGHGLTGMAERAELIGADLIVGPTHGGGWRNHLRLPVEQTRPL